MTIGRFLELLLRSNLCSEQEIKEATRRFDNEQKGSLSDDTALDKLCNFLIAEKALTRWQCDKLRMSKWKGFYLGNYKLLEPIDNEQYPMCYKAKDTDRGNIVRLILEGSNSEGDIKYRVEQRVE
jgi:hypothetical protein